MAPDRSQEGVKSHRRGQRKKKISRRLPVAPWIVMSTVLTLVATLMVAGYIWVLGSGCSGDPIKATVAAPSTISDSLSKAARQWENTEPDVAGRCVAVSIKEKSSDQVASRLANNWDEDVDGPRPDVWVPESQAWLQITRLTDAGAKMIPDSPPLIATSPTVMAMPEPAAKALGWDKEGEPTEEAGEPTWANLAKLAKDGQWSDFGEDWGDITMAMNNPRASTPDLHALLSVVDDDQNGLVESGELDNVSTLKSSVATKSEGMQELKMAMKEADAAGDPMSYASAFPALERDVYQYNVFNNPEVNLEAVYPEDGSMDADHPMAVLRDGENKTYEDIGNQFADYLTSSVGQESLKDDGYRDGTRRTGSEDLTSTDGLSTQVDAAPRKVAEPETVHNTVATWEALERPANVLVAVDSSESMATEESYGGEEKSRLDIVREELKNTLGMFGDQANVGLWQYPSGMGGAYDEVLPMQEFDGAQQDAADGTLDNMVAAGDGGMYDTAVDAYSSVLENYNDSEGAANLVVLISDGGDDAATNSRSAEEMQSELRDLAAADRSKSASIMTIGYGDNADDEQLENIANATQGSYYAAKWSDQINTQLLNALFYAS